MKQISTTRPSDPVHRLNRFISFHIVSYPYLKQLLEGSQSPSLLLPTKRILHTPSNGAIRVEVLANRTVTRKRSADLLADTADGAVFGESAADGTLCVESGGGFLVGGVLTAGESVSMYG